MRFGYLAILSQGRKEDLACELLCLLFREEPGQKVLFELVGDRANKDCPIELETRRLTLGCIPDVQLIQSHKTVALLELKCWAALTPHQLSGHYLRVAPHLIFIVPAERLVSVKRELADQSTKCSLEMRSWSSVLQLLSDAVERNGTRDERLFVGAVEHPKEFCNVIERETFIPFTADQLNTPIRDSSAKHLIWLTREVLSIAKQRELIRENGKLGADFDEYFYYGQNVILRGYRIWLGYWPKAWYQSPASGPLGLEFWSKDALAPRETGGFQDGIRVDQDLAFPLLKADHKPAADQAQRVKARGSFAPRS